MSTPCWSTARARRRDPVGLQKYAALAEETAARIDHKLHLAIAQRAWGVAHTLAGEYPQAEVCLKQALDIFHSLFRLPGRSGRTLFEIGELARLQMQTEQARRLLFTRIERVRRAARLPPYAARVRAHSSICCNLIVDLYKLH